LSAANAVAVAGPKPLKPESLDRLAAEYLSIEQELEQERLALTERMKAKSERLAELEKEFIEVCNAFGSPHEKKSRLLSGLEFEIMTTISSSTSLDQAAVGAFEAQCVKAQSIRIFRALFEKVSTYRSRHDADGVLRRSSAALSPSLAKGYLRCVLTKTNPPRLSAVRPRKKESAA